MKREPLATIANNGRHHADPDFQEWLLLGGKRGQEDNWLESLADDINAAVEKREAPLLALLDRVRTTFRNHPPAGPEDERCQFCELLDAIDAADPGEWVPAAKYRELERVLGDLKEECRDAWRERCERAIAALRSTKVMNAHGVWFNSFRAAHHALAALEGRDPSEETPHSPDATRTDAD